MPGRVLREAGITRRDVRARPRTIFVFGDNMMRMGRGGQAREMRGEPNAFGVPTKWCPKRTEPSFFSDADFDAVRVSIDMVFDHLESYREMGFDIVIPADGIGTGRAELPDRAPRIFAYIEARIAALDAV